jgi:transmembrane sensor
VTPIRSVETSSQATADDAAAEWLVRRDRGPLSQREEVEFQSWLAADPGNERAYDKVCASWDAFEGSDDDPIITALRQEAARAAPEPKRRWWLAAGAGIAASVAAALVMIPGTLVSPGDRTAQVAASDGSDPQPAAVAANPNNYATRKGERRVISLPDGSTVTLNTNTAIEIAFTAGKRLVRLTRGQALFEVAKDRAHPFVVEAGGRQVTALGTVFEVRLDPGRVKVLLVEGRVVVDKLDGALAEANVEPTILKPGEELLAELGAVQRVSSPDVTSELLWKDGYIEFHDAPLGEAVAEINRYSRQELVIKDPDLANMRLSGVFRTGDPQRFSALVGELLPVTVKRAPSGKLEMVARS